MRLRRNKGLSQQDLERLTTEAFLRDNPNDRGDLGLYIRKRYVLGALPTTGEVKIATVPEIAQVTETSHTDTIGVYMDPATDEIIDVRRGDTVFPRTESN